MGACFTAIVFSSNCLIVKELKTIKYRLRGVTAESVVKEATYTITPKKHNLTINGSSFAEEKTQCRAIGPDKTLIGRLKLTNPVSIGADKIAHAHFGVPRHKLNVPVAVTKDVWSGFSIK